MASNANPASAAAVRNASPNTSTQQNGAIANNSTLGPAVNRKKQKRRQKQAAERQASAQRSAANDSEAEDDDYLYDYDAQAKHVASATTGASDLTSVGSGLQDTANNGAYPYPEVDQRYAYDPSYQSPNGSTLHFDTSGATTRQKTGPSLNSETAHRRPYPRSAYSQPPRANGPRPISEEALRTVQRKVKDPIWDTSTAEERARIKEFWLALGEDQRRSLVKIEKEAVLRKMKEQQKHSCSCTVCGRKRTAIEEELEVLYDAYYEELEQFANKNPNHARYGQLREAPHGSVPTLPPTKSRSTHPSTSRRVPGLLKPRKASRGRVKELPDDADEYAADEAVEDEEYDTQDENYDDDDPSPRGRGEPDGVPSSAKDFFTFGNSLTVQGGILTVADDLLKNDGQKFIDMMEQLAERRMQREDVSQYPAYNVTHAPLPSVHNHLPPSEDEYDDEEEEEDYGTEEEDFEEEDDTDTMTEDQRMQEGRRMFQIFAARMFEQRVLTAYREKVALERQEKLIKELEADQLASTEKDLKKARDAEKKKQKKLQQKQAKAEEKAKKDEAKASGEAALRAAEERKQEELKAKREELRKKKEAERKAQEEDKQRKETEKLRRQQEERDRQQEAERKSRELKAEEKKRREEVKKKEAEEREGKEKERKAAEEKQRLEREEKLLAGKDAKDKVQQDLLHPEAVKRPSVPALVALPPGLKQIQSSGIGSPQAKIATPVLPKAPAPVRSRETVRVSQIPSVRTPAASASPDSGPQSKQATPSRNSTTKFTSQLPGFPGFRTINQQPVNLVAPPPGMQQQQQHAGQFGGMLPSIMTGFPSSVGQMAPATMPRMSHGQQLPMYSPHAPPQSVNQRPFMHTGVPPGMMPQGTHIQTRPFMAETPIGYPSTPITPASGNARLPSPRDALSNHIRKASMPFSAHELPHPMVSAQPIARPAPIGRPASVKPIEINGGTNSLKAEMEDLSNHLGSSALLDDSDEPLPVTSTGRRVSGAPRNLSTSMGGSSFEQASPYTLGGRSTSFDNWGPTPTPFSSSSYNGLSGWGSAQNVGWSNPGAFYGQAHRSANARPVTVRLLATKACKTLSALSSNKDTGFVDITDLLRQVNSLRQPHEAPIDIAELSPILETEGDSHNGGGTFRLKRDAADKRQVKWEADALMAGSVRGGSMGLGEIGSPIPGNSMPFGIIRGF